MQPERRNPHQSGNPVELLDAQNTSPELLEFALEGWRRGSLKFAEITNVDRLQSRHFRFLVIMHELGHAIVAKALGWVVKTFTAVPGPGYQGMVEVVPPKGISYLDYKISMGKIAAAGQEAIGSKMGAGSDDAQVEWSTFGIGVGKSHLHSFARGLLYPRTMMRALAWENLPEAA